MKAKLFRGATFIVLSVVLFLLLNYRYAQSTYYQSMEGVFRYENISDSLQIVNFGDSHGQYGIDYSVISDYKCFNFAMASQMLYFDERLLENYKSYFGKDCIVIIPVSYYSLYMNAEDYMFDQLPRYYRVLDSDKIPGFGINGLVLYKYLPVLSAKKNFVKAFVSRQPIAYTVPDGTTDIELLEDIGKRRAAGHLKRIPTDHSIDVEQVEALTEMLQICRENGWKPVVITTPLTIYYDKWFLEDFKDQFHMQINELIADYPEVVYWDYSSDERFYERPEYFVDTDHLNQAGRELFTEILFNDCEYIGLV